MSKKKKFRDVWGSQTDIGKRFGISAIKVGKILVQHDLKDQETKHATPKALNEGYAKSTPLKNGTPHYMWNLQKVSKILRKQYTPLSQVEYWINEVKVALYKANQSLEIAEDKLAYLMYDAIYEEVPKNRIFKGQ